MTMRFKAVVLHDAEDVIHPQELWVQNGVMPAVAMAQLPVVPLPRSGVALDFGALSR